MRIIWLYPQKITKIKFLLMKYLSWSAMSQLKTNNLGNYLSFFQRFRFFTYQRLSFSVDRRIFVSPLIQFVRYFPPAYSTNGLLKEFHAQWNLLLILEVQQKILAISGSRSDCCNKTILRFELYHKDKVIPFPKYLSLIT